jgi:hypothetical protein
VDGEGGHHLRQGLLGVLLLLTLPLPLSLLLLKGLAGRLVRMGWWWKRVGLELLLEWLLLEWVVQRGLQLMVVHLGARGTTLLGERGFVADALKRNLAISWRELGWARFYLGQI